MIQTPDPISGYSVQDRLPEMAGSAQTQDTACTLSTCSAAYYMTTTTKGVPDVEINTNPHKNFTFRENILEIRNVTVGSFISVHYRAKGKPLFGVFLESCADLEGPVDYVLKNNIKANRTPCFLADGIENMTLDLSGFEINGNGGEAISIRNSKIIEIFNGKIRNSSNAILARDSLNLTLKDLQLTNSTFGVFFSKTNDSSISSVNASFNTQDGIRIENSNNTIVTETRAFNNTNGVHFRFSLFNNVSFGNNASFNVDVGIRFFSSNITNATNNSAGFNNIGLRISSSKDYSIFGNVYFDNAIQNELIDPTSGILSSNNKLIDSLSGIEIIEGSDMLFTRELLINHVNSIVLNASTNITFADITIINSTQFDMILINSNATIINTPINIGKLLLIGNSNLFGLVFPANIDIEPDNLNLKSKGEFITVFIEVPTQNVSQIDISSVRINDTVPAISDPKFGFVKNLQITDQDNDGLPELMVKFRREDTESIINNNGPTTLTVTGKIGAFGFSGSDAIRVIGFSPSLTGRLIFLFTSVTRWLNIISSWLNGV